MKILSLILCILLLTTAHAATETSTAWGKIVYIEKTIQNVSYQYFIYFEKDGNSQAYPLETTEKRTAELVKKNVGQRVKIQGQIKESLIALDGQKKRALVFVPESITPLSLADIRIDDAPLLEKVPGAKKAKYNDYTGAIRIPDAVANTLIFSGAALMLGMAVKDLLKK